MTDALCLYDLDAYGRELNSPLDELYQDLVHRLLETRGTNIDDPDRGVGLRDLLSAGYNPENGATQLIKAPIETDFRKDDRVQDVSASALVNLDGSIAVAIQVVANGTTMNIDVTFAGGTLTVTSVPPGQA